ncbi:uncharacterized protein DS421_15g496590 [Arachis hypogaea]|nr:uncharacterized protein DS421_15g496590 [Arachis hypogaea]
MALEDEKRFNLYWNFNVPSPKIQLQVINAPEVASIQMLSELWNDMLISLRTILVDEHAARNVVAIRRRLTSSDVNDAINPGNSDRVSSSATSSNVPLPPKFSSGDGHKVHDVEDKESQASEFVDEYLLTEKTKSGLAKLPLEETLPQVQRMLLRSATYIRDVEKEISIFRSEVLEQEKDLKEARLEVENLNRSVKTLREEKQSIEAKFKTLEEAKATSVIKKEKYKKQISELMQRVDELSLSVRKIEQAVVDVAFDIEKNMLDQIKLIAPDLDASNVGVFKKVVDRKIVDII